MVNREIFVRLKADVSGFKRAMNDASADSKAAVDKLSTTAGLMGAAMVAAAGTSVKAFADFDQAMSNVQAATMESAGNMQLLRDAALEAGARTAFSATEAAAGVEELAKAGVSTADILSGGLDGALDLAAAGGIAVGEAAETAASALTQFGLEGADVTHIADLLAAGASKAQGGVSDLGAALNQSGLVAAQMGLSIDETVGSLTAFASAGLIGSDAGTSFRAMLLRLANPTKESAELMSDLGISVYDTQGNFVGMESVAGQLQDRMGTLDQETRNAALATIFGQDAIRAAAILYEQGAEGVATWTDAVDDAGFAAETAAIRMDNLKGDWEQFTGAIETALIGAGEGADGPLRKLVQGATELVNAFSALPAPVQQSMSLLTGGGGLAVLGVVGMVKMVGAARDAKDAMEALNISTGKLTGAMKGLGGAVAVIGFAALAKEAYDFLAADQVKQVDNLTASLEGLADGVERVPELGDLFENRNAIRFFAEDVQTADDALAKFADQAQQALGQGFADKLERFLGNGSMAKFEAQVSQIDAALAEMVNGGNAEGARAALQAFLDAAEGNGVDRGAVEAMFSGYASALDTVASAAAGTTAAQSELNGQLDETTGSVESQSAAIMDLIKAQRAAAGISMTVMEAESAFQAALDGATEAVKKNGQTLDLNTEAGRANQAALLDVAKAGWDNVDAQAAAGASGAELQVTMQRSRDAFIRAAEAAGMSSTEAKRLADKLGLIPKRVNTDIQANATQAIAAAEAAARAIGKIPTYKMFTMDGQITSAFQSASYAAANTRFTTIQRAAGGYISGPGSATSDSIPARLSNGEYVVKASAVKQYGRSFFDAVNAQRFASGGYAGGGSVSAPSLNGLSITGRLVMDTGGFVQLVDARIHDAQRAQTMSGRPA